MAEIKATKTYSIENLTYEQLETIYAALMAFKTECPNGDSGEEAREELKKAFKEWV
jgi:predicted RNase H-like HicB family nuclease